ncbi:MAG: DUF1295 domain-containing protein [Pseudomonadales bacterium]|nr:DUF1295 domain-containing protein [Pseudomonadales bacterium]
MTDFFSLYASAALAVLVALTLLWLVSVAIRDASIIDLFWGPGFVLCNWVTFMLAEGSGTGRMWLVHALVTLWGLRLAMHLFVRNAGAGEDARYRRWRENGGPNWWLVTYYRIYLFQGAIMMLVALPVIIVNAAPEQASLGWLDIVGGLVWLCGFCFETVADQQLVSFRRNPDNAGRVLDTGLWRYSLHPNYFGDALSWWGLAMIAASVPGGWISFIGPVVMTGVFLGVSNGVLERALTKSRPGYAEHVRRTSAFFPLPRRRPGGEPDSP